MLAEIKKSFSAAKCERRDDLKAPYFSSQLHLLLQAEHFVFLFFFFSPPPFFYYYYFFFFSSEHSIAYLGEASHSSVPASCRDFFLLENYCLAHQ